MKNNGGGCFLGVSPSLRPHHRLFTFKSSALSQILWKNSNLTVACTCCWRRPWPVLQQVRWLGSMCRPCLPLQGGKQVHGRRRRRHTENDSLTPLALLLETSTRTRAKGICCEANSANSEPIVMKASGSSSDYREKRSQWGQEGKRSTWAQARPRWVGRGCYSSMRPDHARLSHPWSSRVPLTFPHPPSWPPPSPTPSGWSSYQSCTEASPDKYGSWRRKAAVVPLWAPPSCHPCKPPTAKLEARALMGRVK